MGAEHRQRPSPGTLFCPRLRTTHKVGRTQGQKQGHWRGTGSQKGITIQQGKRLTEKKGHKERGNVNPEVIYPTKIRQFWTAYLEYKANQTQKF